MSQLISICTKWETFVKLEICSVSKEFRAVRTMSSLIENVQFRRVATDLSKLRLIIGVTRYGFVFYPMPAP